MLERLETMARVLKRLGEEPNLNYISVCSWRSERTMHTLATVADTPDDSGGAVPSSSSDTLSVSSSSSSSISQGY